MSLEDAIVEEGVIHKDGKTDPTAGVHTVVNFGRPVVGLLVLAHKDNTADLEVSFDGGGLWFPIEPGSSLSVDCHKKVWRIHLKSAAASQTYYIVATA